VKIWIDACEPKTVIMLKSLYEKLKEEHEVYITSRDFDSTIYLLEKYNIPHYRAGKHGGGTKLGKLKSYSQRLKKLISITEKENPEFLFCLASPEALRIAFGLNIPNIIFNDEPRSKGVVSLTLSLADQVIVPRCIPVEWYLNYIDGNKLIRFNGIDEVGWLSEFQPNEDLLDPLKLSKEEYLIFRTEPTKAQYLAERMKPYETQLMEIIPNLLPLTDLKCVIITRYEEQFNYLSKYFKKNIDNEQVLIYKALENLDQIMFFSKGVITGGGTMVRESALLGVPSIEYFPLETYPQEQFLIENGFPLKHIKESKKIISEIIKILESNHKINTKPMIKTLDNPLEIAINEFRRRSEI